jgi:PAS domain S-box-containing protein
VVSYDLKISFVNPRAELFLGWPAEELLGRDCHETLHYHVPANECKVNGEIRIGEEYHSEEYSFMRRDGRILPVALTATPVRRDGAVVGAVVTFQDITARLAAEKAVRESEVRFRTLFNSSGDLVHPLIGKDGGFGKFVEVNDIACQRLGYTRAEMLSMTPLDLDIPGSFPSPAEIEAVQKGILDEGRLMFERVHVTKDGRQIPVEINAHTFELNGEMMTLSIVRDITERKQAENLLLANEERIHLATSAGNVGIWDWDVANNKLVWDENMYTLYGMSEKDFDGAYEAWSRTLHPDDRQCVEVEMQAALHGEREYAPEFRIVRPDGCIRNIQASAKSFFDPQGNPLRMIGTNLDITERKQTEAALREAKIEAEQANHAKSEFLAHMSHEIRTPLNAIVGAARLMDGENLTPQQTSYARIMRHSSRSLLTLIQNILDLSKIEAGCAELETGIFELAPIIDGLAGVATASAQGKDIAFNFDLAPDLPPRLMGDPYRLEQVLNNLLSNAIKFTTQGEVSLRVQKVSEDEKSARLLFTLADTGIGISREKLGVIFEPFAQAENTTTRTHGGTGLGLAISRRLVEMMGGAIEIESTPGKGSRFTFTVTFQLPTAAEIAPTQASQRIECADFSPATTPLAGRRVLMVEDNEFNRVVLEGILQRFGIQVDAAIDGYDGVERFQAGCPYDAILMDLHLPGQDGFDCTRAIRALPEGAQVPIIAFTANVLSTTGSKCRAAGMNDHLSKPVEPDILLRTLIYWILGEGSSAPVKAAPAAEDQTDRLPDALPGIDRAKALAFSIGARAFAKLLDHMLSHCGNDPAKLAQHIRGGDIEAAAGITHDLMSVSSMVGASALFDAARQLNHELRAGNPASALAQEASDSMATEFARLNEAREILRPWLD